VSSKRAVIARSVSCLALGLLSSAWLANTGPLSGPTEPRPRPDGRLSTNAASQRRLAPPVLDKVSRLSWWRQASVPCGCVDRHSHWQERFTPGPVSECNRLVRDEHLAPVLLQSVSVARHSSADDALPARHRRLKTKRLRRLFGGLPSSTALRNKLRVAGIVGAIEVTPLVLPAPSRDHARAPPVSTHPA
jgi:hypothetical protein